MYQTTIEHYQKKLKNKYPNENFTVLKFTEVHSPVEIQCNTCKKIIHYKDGGTPMDARHNCLCSSCKTKTVSKVLQICQLDNLEIIENPGYVTSPWTFKCNNCGNEFLLTPSQLKEKYCKFCNDKQAWHRKSILEWQKDFNDTFGNGEFTVLDDILPTSRKIKIRHKCGFIKTGQAHALLACKGCPKCAPKLSKGEQKIINYFDSHNIRYEYQSQMGDTRQSFDFKIGNIVIEYNGEQHYYPIQTFGGEERYAQQKEFDENKKQYCRNNNLELIIIPYYDYCNIDTILDSLLMKLNDQSNDVAK